MKPITQPELKDFLISPADPTDHLIPISQIVSDAFAGGQYVKEIGKTYIGNCHYDFDVTRLIWKDDRLVHHWGVWGYPMRLGAVQLQVAGIGAVVTREEHRRQGLMAYAAQESFKAMHRAGYDLTILRGRHYHKFGYRRAWNYVTTRLKPDEIPERELQRPYQDLGLEHMDAFNALYNAEYSPFSGTAVRPTYRMRDTDELDCKGWFDDSGELLGYVRAVPTEDKQTLQCLEAAGDPDQCLAVLGELFQQGEYQDLTFFTFPHDHPLVQQVRLGFCVVENRYFYHTGWLVKVINLLSALTKMVPLFEKRIRQSHLVNWTGTLLLEGETQQAALHLDKGAVRIEETTNSKDQIIAGAALGRLLIGSDEPDEVILEEGITCQGRGAELAQVLFPNMHPMMSHFDEF
jgi:predicted N-acetyltransferase YhbS